MNLGWGVIALATGFLLGLFYFSGLWLTVRRVPMTKRPASLLLGSFLIRTAVVVLGFYLAMNGSWERAAFCMVGFLFARSLMIRRLHGMGQISNESTPSLNARSPTT